jgi:hypothetical protein
MSNEKLKASAVKVIASMVVLNEVQGRTGGEIARERLEAEGITEDVLMRAMRLVEANVTEEELTDLTFGNALGALIGSAKELIKSAKAFEEGAK